MATAYLAWHDATLAFEGPTFAAAREAAQWWQWRHDARLRACDTMTFDDEGEADASGQTEAI